MRNMILLFVLFFFLSFSFAAEETYGSLEIKRVVRVYDGDTFYANLVSVHPIIGNNIGIRIRGVDTPERRGGTCKALAYEVRDYLAKRLEEAKKVELRNVSRGKYFRIVADVFIDGVNISEELISLDYAYPYNGGTKKEWVCP